MTEQEVIEAYGVRLRPFHTGDTADVVDGCADPVSQRFVSNLPAPYTDVDARWWIEVGAPAAWTGGGAAYAIADPATDRLLGAVGLNNPVSARGQVEIGYWVRPAARGRGVATAATRALSDHAFAAGTARLELLTEPENASSQRVALAAGYRYEGSRRSAGSGRNGDRHDLLAWVRLADDPPGPTARLLPDLPGGLLTDGVVTVRRLAPDDAELMHRLHSRPEVVANQAPPVPPTPEATQRRCLLAESAWLTGVIARLMIVDVASGAPAGSCGMSITDAASGEGSVGYALLPEWRGRGYATRAVRLLAAWAFGSAGVTRLVAGTVPGNVASHRVLERVGFQREGLQRGRLPGLDGTRLDDLTFALLPTDLR
ncbi:GNAT family N-acetyltransferase [Micromonospora sp. M51]|uniref:GNAT family N-acetyltransferase n=1 Tax=Micromonospora parva TaxID=1464048 RepID=A0ABW6W0C9_9ACTN|nr:MULTISPECIES: GNAT family N-acetyltransferase [Micromonospora]MBQ1012708.1 GNAT family N-acetyltransferase [Micromonospora sp. M51]MBQ1029992.1 GNAT family N-acetyltransferase [Micromonospora sp. C97]